MAILTVQKCLFVRMDDGNQYGLIAVTLSLSAQPGHFIRYYLVAITSQLKPSSWFTIIVF